MHLLQDQTCSRSTCKLFTRGNYFQNSNSDSRRSKGNQINFRRHRCISCFAVSSAYQLRYGRDIGTNIAELLFSILPHLKNDVMLRIGMTNPPYILEHLDAIVEVLNHKNVYTFIHIPVQSGSDKVLLDMKRVRQSPNDIPMI